VEENKHDNEKMFKSHEMEDDFDSDSGEEWEDVEDLLGDCDEGFGQGTAFNSN
jgi:hypothetical protein